MADAADYRYMARALRLARRGLYTTHPNPRVGCVLVKGGEVLGEGWHERAGEPHAEIHALGAAGSEAAGATAYITLEPCCHFARTPPCTDALIAAQVKRVVAGTLDPNPRVGGEGLKRLSEAGIAVESGVLDQQAETLNRGFFSRMRRGRPWVRLKSAISLDGRTAMASGESQWISGEAARRDVQFLRAQSSAIMSGSATVLADDPSLNVRLGCTELGITGEVCQPMRVILDTGLRLRSSARLFALPGESLVLTASADSSRAAELERAGARVVQVSAEAGGVDLNQVMEVLAREEINEVQVEAGPVLSGALLKRGLVDELVIYMAPHLMGDAGRGLVRLPAMTSMNERLGLQIQELRTVGHDLRIVAGPLAEG